MQKKSPKSSKLTGLTDEQLMLRFLQGGKEAVIELLSKYERQMFGYFLAGVRDTETSKDLVREVCATVLNKAAQWRTDKPVGPWLWTIIANTRRQFLRQDHRHRLLMRDNADMIAAYTRAQMLTPGEAAQLLERESILPLKLYECILCLPSELREVFVLKGIDRLSRKDVAELLNIKIGTVQGRWNRALTKLRACLAIVKRDL